MKSKKILMLLTNSFRPDPRVYKEAKTLIENGFEVDLICLDKNNIGRNEVFEGINIIRINVGKVKQNAAINRFIKMLKFKKIVYQFIKKRKDKYTIIHSHDFDTLSLGVKLKSYLGSKLIFDAHELVFGYKGFINDRLINFILSFIVKINIKHVDHTITTSYERLVLLSSKFGIKFSDISVINNYPILKENFIKEKNNKVIFQYQGVIDKKRNILNIFKAITLLSEEDKKKVRLIIYGDDENSYSLILKEYNKKHNLENIISFRGFLRFDKLGEETKKTDVGFAPLLQTHLNNIYPAPNKIYDYISRKNIVVSQNTFGISNNILENNLGYNCDFNNVEDIRKIISLILSFKSLDKWQEDVYLIHIEKYNWERLKFLKIYDDISKI